MKDILSLKRAITDTDYYETMFSKWGSEKNILFVSPQLSGKHLYKSILPFQCLPDKKEDGELIIATGITSLKPYDYRKQLIEYEIELTDKHIHWADFIIFPFTTQPLSQDVYKKIRGIKHSVKIMYSVDFNFYELSELNPYKNIFSDSMILSQVEDNMYFSDSVIVDNLMLADYLVKKVKSLMEGKYKDVQGYMGITCLPTMIDSEIVLKNVEYEPENALFVKKESIHSPAVNDLIEETEKAALKLKEEYLKNKIVESEVKKEDAKEEKTVKVKSKTKPKTKTKKETSIVNKPKKKKIVNKKQTTKKTANARTRK
jgi:hypothetical protein